MTASKVSQVNLYANAASGVSQVNNNRTDDFSTIFAAQSAESGNETRTNQETEVKTTDKSDEVSEAKETSAAENTQKTETVEEKQDVSETDKAEEAKSKDEEPDTEAMMEAVSELMATIQEVLGVSAEELQSALNELGISAEELLNTENIPALVIALTEGADELSVMTNEELFSNMQEITAKAEGLLNDLAKQMNLSPEELKGMLQNMQEAETVAEEPVQTVAPDKTTDVPVLEENRVQVSVEKPQNSQSTESNGRENAASDNGQMTFAQTVAQQVEQAVAKTETTYSTFSATTENIMNQIQDTIRIIQTQDVTEMELQLNPESLGHVRVQLAAKEGVITATFTTENEVVRAALESQMITLRQNFEGQGIKVEAVEVTVASHAFEHNLNGDENDAGEQPAPEKKKNTRRISLTDLMNGIEEEEISDEDRIVAEMMRQNGNTVDYTV